MSIVRKSVALAAASIVLGATAFAGFTQPAPVTVDLAIGVASGDQLSARLDPDPDVFIGCGTRTVPGGAFGFCQAEDAEGDRVVCATLDAVLVDAIRATSDFAFISFGFVDDGNGGFECVRVGTSTQSFYLFNYGALKTK